jgi:5S rRNA maturation endonuclease (ribonuclease M5)
LSKKTSQQVVHRKMPGLNQQSLAAKRKLLQTVLEDLPQRLVVVEGPKDAKALEITGCCTSTVMCGGRRLEVVAENAAKQSNGMPVLVLTDFDSEGERKAGVLETLLAAQPVKVDRQLRKRFRAVFGIRTIEELPAALEREMEETE